MADNLPQSGVELVARYAAQFIGDLGKAEKAVDSFGDQTVKDSARVEKSGAVMAGVFAGVGIAIVDMAAEGARAIGSFVQDSIGAAGDFESGMNEFEIAAGDALGAAGLKTEEFKDLFLSLGQELPVSTSEVQAAATTLIKGGLDPMILKLGGLKDSLNFAAAAGMGLEEAADLSVKQLSTFVRAGASAEEQTAFLANAQNLMVEAAGASTLEVDALGDAMLGAAGQAKAMDVDYQDFVTTMGLIAPSFSSAAEAGTSYKNFLSRLTPATAPAIDAMAQLGLLTDDGKSKFFDATGAFIGNEKAAGLLQNALKGLSAEQKSTALETIFGNEAAGAAIALADKGAEGYQEFAASMDSASGVAETAAGKQKGFNNSVDNMMGSIEAAQIVIGEKFLPILGDVIDRYIIPGINYITDFAKAFDTSTVSIDGIGEAFTRAVQAFRWVQEGIATMSQIWSDTLMPAIRTGVGFFQEHLLPIFTDIADGILPVLSARADILGAIFTDIVMPAVKTLWDVFDRYLLPVLKDVAAWMADVLPPAAEVVRGIFVDHIIPAVSEGIKLFDTLVGSFDDGEKSMGSITPFLTKVGDVISDVGAIVAELAKKYLPMLQSTWEKDLLPAIMEGQRFFVEDLMPILSDLAATILPILGIAIDLLASIWTNVFVPVVKVVWGIITDLLIPVLSLVVDWLREYLPPAIAFLAAGFTDVLLPAVKYVLGFFSNFVIPGFRLIGEMLAGSFTWAIDGVVGAFNFLLEIGRHVSGALNEAWDHSIGAMVRGFEGIGAAIRDAIHWIQEVGRAILGIPPPPEWYRPGSPTPFELGMRGIAGSTEQASMGVSDFARSMQGLERVTPDAMPGMGASSNVTTTYNQQRSITMPVYTNNSPAVVQQSMAYYAALEGGTL